MGPLIPGFLRSINEWAVAILTSCISSSKNFCGTWISIWLTCQPSGLIDYIYSQIIVNKCNFQKFWRYTTLQTLKGSFLHMGILCVLRDQFGCTSLNSTFQKCTADLWLINVHFLQKWRATATLNGLLGVSFSTHSTYRSGGLVCDYYARITRITCLWCWAAGAVRAVMLGGAYQVYQVSW